MFSLIDIEKKLIYPQIKIFYHLKFIFLCIQLLVILINMKVKMYEIGWDAKPTELGII